MDDKEIVTLALNVNNTQSKSDLILKSPDKQSSDGDDSEENIDTMKLNIINEAFRRFLFLEHDMIN